MWIKKQKTFNENFDGLVPSLQLVGYIAMVGWLMADGEKIFGRVDRYWGPVLFLTLFVFSALFSALIVFYKPYQLFADGKGKEALNLVVKTAKWLAAFLVVIFLIVMFI